MNTQSDESMSSSPHISVFSQSYKNVTLHTVWIYPYELLKRGAKVIFFHVKRSKTLVCCMYFPQDLEIDENYSSNLDKIAILAITALAEYGYDFRDIPYDVHVDAGELNISDLLEDND